MIEGDMAPATTWVQSGLVLFCASCFPGPLELEDTSDVGSDVVVTDSVVGDSSDAANTDVPDVPVVSLPDTDTEDSVATEVDAQALDADGVLDSEVTEVVDDVTGDVPDALDVLDVPTTLDASDICTPTGAELCNGVDDNCNGATDEGFVDTDSNGVADCVDDDDDGDGILDVDDDEPLIPWVDPCADPIRLGRFVGCSFWTLDGPVWSDPDATLPEDQIEHALIVLNEGPDPANVTISFGTDLVHDPVVGLVEPGAQRTFQIPASPTVLGLSATAAYVVSDRPVSAMQLNPYAAGASSDASMLLPEHSLGLRYAIATWNTFGNFTEITGIPSYHGWFVVVASEDDTVVEITSDETLIHGGALGPTGATYMQRGDVLTIMGKPAEWPSFDGGADLTGALVTSTKPVAVVAGHERLIFDVAGQSMTCCAGRLETQAMPITTGQTFILAPPRGTDPEAQYIWRVIATEANTLLRTTNGNALNNVMLEEPGDWAESRTAFGVSLATTKPVAVYLYVMGQVAYEDPVPEGLSSPSLVAIAPIDEWTAVQQVAALDGFDSHVTIIRVSNSTVSVNGDIVPNDQFKYVPGTFGLLPHQYAHVELAPGLHSIRGLTKVGVVLHGYAHRSSYATWVGGWTPLSAR